MSVRKINATNGRLDEGDSISYCSSLLARPLDTHLNITVLELERCALNELRRSPLDTGVYSKRWGSTAQHVWYAV